MNIVLVGLNARYTHSCLALFYLRNELTAHLGAIQPTILQCTINDPFYQLLLQLGEFRADCYFFSAAIWNSDLLVRLIEDLYKIRPHCQIVVGGPQAEIVGEALNDGRVVLVTGEFEGVEQRFYADLRRRQLHGRYSCGRSGRDFSFPYHDSDFTTHLRNRHIYYESSRGCPFSCTYCLSASQGGVFHKDIETVIMELRQILRHNPRVVRFIDRTFNDNCERALAIWQFLAEQDCDTLFHFEISPDRFTEEMFTLLDQLPVGKFQFEIGIQSTSSATLEAIRRPMNVALAGTVIRRLRLLKNIHLHVDLILGLPREDRESFLQSFADVFAMEPHYIQMGLLKILPDTPICHTALEDGYSFSSSPPYSVLANRWMDHGVVQQLYWFGEAVERFVNTRYFVSLWRHFRQEQVDITKFFSNLVKICHENDFFQRAPTQEFLVAMLLKSLDSFSDSSYIDQDYIVELLRYDWLRCGHRYLPAGLEVDEAHSSKVVKRKLHGALQRSGRLGELDAETVYSLKKGFVLAFSSVFLRKQGYADEAGDHYLCFTPQRETTLYRFNRVVSFVIPYNS
ncbi:MAG: radical SAM protein [Desulfopila sp.]